MFCSVWDLGPIMPEISPYREEETVTKGPATRLISDLQPPEMWEIIPV